MEPTSTKLQNIYCQHTKNIAPKTHSRTVKKLRRLKQKISLIISYDACRLFTSIPLNEIINIVVNLIFENKTRLHITKDDLKKKIKRCAISGPHFLFLFDGCYHDQVDGVFMGSPLCPGLADIFS